jgi:hypothetical protein
MGSTSFQSGRSEVGGKAKAIAPSKVGLKLLDSVAIGLKRTKTKMKMILLLRNKLPMSKLKIQYNFF